MAKQTCMFDAVLSCPFRSYIAHTLLLSSALITFYFFVHSASVELPCSCPSLLFIFIANFLRSSLSTRLCALRSFLFALDSLRSLLRLPLRSALYSLLSTFYSLLPTLCSLLSALYPSTLYPLLTTLCSLLSVLVSRLCPLLSSLVSHIPYLVSLLFPLSSSPSCLLPSLFTLMPAFTLTLVVSASFPLSFLLACSLAPPFRASSSSCQICQHSYMLSGRPMPDHKYRVQENIVKKEQVAAGKEPKMLTITVRLHVLSLTDNVSDVKSLRSPMSQLCLSLVWLI